MKNLYLIRHAEAQPAIGIKDIERNLTEKGQEFIANTINNLKQNYKKPELLIVSPAKRTQQTAEIIKSCWSIPPEIARTEDFLYGSEYQEILKFLQTMDDKYQTIAIVGHNPGISVLVNFFTMEPINMTPGNVCLIEFEVDTWQALGAGTGVLKT